MTEEVDVNTPGNIIISMFALISLGFLIFTIRRPFKSHSFNTFDYIILLLICYSLFGKTNYF